MVCPLPYTDDQSTQITDITGQMLVDQENRFRKIKEKYALIQRLLAYMLARYKQQVTTAR